MDEKAKLIHTAYRGIEKSIPELAEIFQIEDGHPFDVAPAVGKELALLGLIISPPINAGEFEQKRVVSVSDKVPDSYVRDEILKGEGAHLEFKSTLLHDIKQSKSRPDTPIGQISPEKVVHSCLKTVCGFLNAEGGVLYVGIEDNLNIFGLDKDFEFLGPGGDFDKWELRFRSLVEGRFLDGKVVLHHLKITSHTIDCKLVARVEVARREKESFLKDGKNYRFYIRTGNRTDHISIENLPSIVRRRDQNRPDF
ncbi:ATP-binding protein [Alcanivorax sp.]|uniref:AlbA family DNA-binding domain-containing protein n=1 Tax=Alcanivorax sp. TaxID=1872427 RepID=UPI0025BCF2F0|nr:ATP-binding protein [Alcanivorax sp.]